MDLILKKFNLQDHKLHAHKTENYSIASWNMFHSIRHVQGKKRDKRVRGMEVNNSTQFFILNNVALVMQSFGLTNYYSWYNLKASKDAHWSKITKMCQYVLG